MNLQIAFTGPRKLTKIEEKRVYCVLLTTQARANDWHVGDAQGLDSFIVRAAEYWNKNLTVHQIQTQKKWGFAERSQRMIRSATKLGEVTLFAFPNKLCPESCTPKSAFSGYGSGTWGTIAYAWSQGVNLEIHPLFSLKEYADTSWMPDWMVQKQLKLF
ncbi:MAG: hypothetical protein F6K58_25995 [Symploca sp. SIO2E9]|nr:hypothetical protein [Symploca sp. SIO2E9]